MSKVRLGFFFRRFAGGGAERAILEVMSLISRKDYDLYLICYNDSDDYMGEIPAHVKQVVVSKKYNLSDEFLTGKALKKVSLICNELGIQVLHSSMTYNNSSIIKAKLLYDQKVII